jgi:hypothetical protein
VVDVVEVVDGDPVGDAVGVVVPLDVADGDGESEVEGDVVGVDPLGDGLLDDTRSSGEYDGAVSSPKPLVGVGVPLGEAELVAPGEELGVAEAVPDAVGDGVGETVGVPARPAVSRSRWMIAWICCLNASRSC